MRPGGCFGKQFGLAQQHYQAELEGHVRCSSHRGTLAMMSAFRSRQLHGPPVIFSTSKYCPSQMSVYV